MATELGNLHRHLWRCARSNFAAIARFESRSACSDGSLLAGVGPYLSIVAGVALGIGLGWAGLNSYVRLDHLPWSSHLFYTLLLFKFSVPGAARPNTDLEIAMWVAPLTTLYAAFRAARPSTTSSGRAFGFDSPGTRRGARPRRSAPGSPSVSPSEASRCSPSTTRSRPRSGRCRSVVSTASLLAGDASDPDVLSRLDWTGRACLIVVCGSDALNAQPR